MKPNFVRKTKPIPELTSVVLSVNKDTLITTFFKGNDIDYDLIMKKILLPYFKIKSRILKKSRFFKIGEIGYKVVGVSPGIKGIISSKTFIHCNNHYSTQTSVNRTLLLTTQRYDNFNQDLLIREILSTDKPILVNKNEFIKIKQYEFFVRNCEPETGVLNQSSIITIENKQIQNISKIKIAIIKVKLYNLE